MQQVVSAMTGTTATGRLRSSGRSCCSTDAKYEFRSRKSQRTRGWLSLPGWLWETMSAYIRILFAPLAESYTSLFKIASEYLDHAAWSSADMGLPAAESHKICFS